MRILLGLTLLCLSVVLPWWLVLPLWCVYAALYAAAYELIVLGVLLDAYAGTGFAFFYTLAAGVLVIGGELLKSRMRWYAGRVH